MQGRMILLAAVALLTVAIILGVSIRSARHEKAHVPAHEKMVSAPQSADVPEAAEATPFALRYGHTATVPATAPSAPGAGDIRFKVSEAHDLSGHAGAPTLGGLKLIE